MEVDVQSIDQAQRYSLLMGVVVPRPIALISTMATDGALNAAPFSCFNIFSVDPPTIALGINNRPGGRLKDTKNNILATGDFVVNMVNETIAEAMNLASIEADAEVDEFALAGFEPLASTTVCAPRIFGSPASLECRFLESVPIGNNRDILVGRIVHVHFSDSILTGEGHIDHQRLGLIGRLGGRWYTRTRDTFEMERPGSVPAGVAPDPSPFERA